jgi:hypothetical protein
MLLYALGNITQHTTTHLARSHKSTSNHHADFTHNRRKRASSSEGTHRLPEDSIYVPKHVGAKKPKK